MQEQWPINGYYNPSTMEGLYEVIANRVSCRSFQNTPFENEWNCLEHSAKSLALPGTRFVLGTCDNNLFQPFGGLLVKFENVAHYAAIITTDDRPESVINSGICGEMLMLSAVLNGVGGCWVAGTYKHSQVSITLEKSERIRALFALGVPLNLLKSPIVRKRKPIEKITSDDFTNAPPIFHQAALAVLAAPSAMNMQPWRLTFEPENTLSLTVRRPQQRLDLGIALCHAMLAIGNTPAQYELSADALSVRLVL